MKIPINILNIPGKRKHMRQQQKRARTLKVEIQRMTAQIEKLQHESTVDIEEDLTNNLIAIMANREKDIHKLPESSFQ